MTTTCRSALSRPPREGTAPMPCGSRQFARVSEWRSGAFLPVLLVFVIGMTLAPGVAPRAVAQTADSCASNLSFVLDRPDLAGVVAQHLVTGEREVRNLYTMVRNGNDTYIIVSNASSVFSPDTSGASFVNASDTLLVTSPT